ncbi:MAG: hypothetical protein ACNA7G_13585, partial [Methylobacter sp.]
LEKKVSEFMSKNSPEKSMKVLAKLMPDNIDVSRIFEHPIALFGMLMLHAANELGIDVGVTAEEVLKANGITPGSKPPSFPFF